MKTSTDSHLAHAYNDQFFKDWFFAQAGSAAMHKGFEWGDTLISSVHLVFGLIVL